MSGPPVPPRPPESITPSPLKRRHSARKAYYNRLDYSFSNGEIESQQSFLPRIYEPISPSYNQNIEYIYGAVFLFSLIIICMFIWCIYCTVLSAIISFKIGRNTKNNRNKELFEQSDQI